MGGTRFRTDGKGATVEAAFNEAADRARMEHGHGGYTGTIAEKVDCVEWELPPGITADDVEAAFAQVDYDEDGRPEPTQPTRTVTYTRKVRLRDVTEVTTRQLRVGEEAPPEPSPLGFGSRQFNTNEAVISSASKWHKSEAKPSEWVMRAVEAQRKVMAIRGWETYYRIYDEKWGPALAIKTGPDTWTFMGRASC